MENKLCGSIGPNGNQCIFAKGHRQDHYDGLNTKWCVGVTDISGVPWDGPHTITTITHASGTISSKIPRFDYIPHAANVALARRFERGVRLRKEGAWNARAANQIVVLGDKEFLIERLAHGIDHLYKAIGRITGTEPPLSEEEVADGGDAGAIMFAGALLACVDEYNRRRKDEADVENYTHPL